MVSFLGFSQSKGSGKDALLDKSPNLKGDSRHDDASRNQTFEESGLYCGFGRAIYFKSKEIKFKSGVKDKLDFIIRIMKEFPQAKFTIEGHTDNQEKRSQKLSEKRAEKTMKYFLINGISASRLSFIGYGGDYPIGDNNTEEGRAQNRRVEIRLKK